MEYDVDCVVVGGGVAGLSAAMVLGRARRRTLVLDRGRQSNRAAAHVGGLLGHDGTPPAELYELARAQVAAYDAVSLRDAEAVDARAEGDGFAIVLSDGGDEVRARALVLATGMAYEVPDVPGFAELWGGAVFHCPFCHGWEVRDRPVVVYGAGEVADRQAALLAAWTDDVTVVDPDDVAGVRVEDGALQSVVRRDGSEVRCDAVLVHAPLRRRDALPERLGLALTDTGLVAVDAQARTSVPGCTPPGTSRSRRSRSRSPSAAGTSPGSSRHASCSSAAVRCRRAGGRGQRQRLRGKGEGAGRFAGKNVRSGAVGTARFHVVPPDEEERANERGAQRRVARCSAGRRRSPTQRS